MIRLQVQVGLSYLVDDYGADFMFNVLAAHTARQLVSGETIDLNQTCERSIHVDPVTGNRCMRLHGEPGELRLDYAATVDLLHHFAEPEHVPEVPVRELPAEVLGYLYPSRYCQSDRLLRFATMEFGGQPRGYQRVLAIRDWVHRHVAFTSNTSNSNTSAIDTLVERVGVCRDFAHLMIALCRAVNIPARFVTGTDYGCDPGLGPPDFHAYVEVFLGARWYMLDPTGLAIPMGLVRFATGRDAADVPFAMIFGNVRSQPPFIRTLAIESVELGYVRPHHCHAALSTDGAGPGESRG